VTAPAGKVLILLVALIFSPLLSCNAAGSSVAAVREGIDLLQRYPTKLTAGDTRPDHARSWDFKDDDVFRVSQFRLEVGNELRLEVGGRGLGHRALRRWRGMGRVDSTRPGNVDQSRNQPGNHFSGVASVSPEGDHTLVPDRAYRTILGSLHPDGSVAWAVTTNQIGFIAIAGWSDPKVSTECGEALEQMRDTRGLIVDVRLNGGGSEPLAEKFAGRFLEKEFVYAYSQFRNGPSHTNLTGKIERRAVPHGPWRYGRPVLLLIGQKCMSSNESFIGMMTGDPQMMTMGDHTCGSSGNPEMVQLPLEMTVSVLQWIDYLPDGTVLDEHGFQPQIPFEPARGAFEGDRDDLLTAALARLSQLPPSP
jgi:Peptidase family S41